MFSPSDTDILKEEGINDRKTFELFFKTHYTLFLSFACRYEIGMEEARDIVQDVFVAFWEQRHNFTAFIAIKAFCYRAIANRCLNHLKHENVKSNYADSQAAKGMAGEEFIQENIIREEVAFIVRRKIKELSPREQEIIILSLQNKSNQEIAERLSISLATVKTHKMHAYARLRTELESIRFLFLFI